jgi:hypothetical protein
MKSILIKRIKQLLNIQEKLKKAMENEQPLTTNSQKNINKIVQKDPNHRPDPPL